MTIEEEMQLRAENVALKADQITVRERRELKKERQAVKQALVERRERELSLPKALQTFREEVKKLGKALAKEKRRKLKQVINKLRKRWECYCLKEWRAVRISSASQVKQVDVSRRSKGLKKAC
jgi:chromosome segregation ATPase